MPVAGMLLILNVNWRTAQLSRILLVKTKGDGRCFFVYEMITRRDYGF